MRRWKKSKILKKILLVLLACSVLVSVFSGMYMQIGSSYAQLDGTKEEDFFVSQEGTRRLLDGYIRLYEEYMQIAGIITTDGSIDYDKKILVSVLDGKSYTVKELLKNSLSEGDASRKLREFMDDFDKNCETGKSYPWVSRYILKSDSRVILDEENIYRFQSPNSVELSEKQIQDMRKRQGNMTALVTDSDTYREDLEETITVILSDSKDTKLVFPAKSNYEEYIATYFPAYAKYYFVQKAVDSFSESNQEDFSEAYDAFHKRQENGDCSRSKFLKLLQKTEKKYHDMLTEDKIPWKAHVLPRTMEEAKKYVTFLVETYQELKYLFSNSNFFFAYENSQNLLITNNQRAWGKVKSAVTEGKKVKAAVDTDDITYAYFNGRGYEGRTNFSDGSFSMSGDVLEKLRDIGTTFNSGTYQICVGIDLQGVRNQRYEDEFTRSYLESHRKFDLFQMGRSVLLFGVLLGVICFILLFALSGGNAEDGKEQLWWFDKIWLEFQLLATYVSICMIAWFIQLWGGADSLPLILLFGTAIWLLLCLCIAFLFFIVKRARLHCFVRYSLILSFISEVLFKKAKIGEWYRERRIQLAFADPKRKNQILLLFEAGILVYYICCGVMVSLEHRMTITSFFVSPPGITAIFLALCLFIVFFTLQRNYFRCEEAECMLVEGTKKILDGDFDYQINDCVGAGFRERELLETINKIGEVLEHAVEESVKSERMKTELIANVSHDIKTPLTSVINYIDLLKRQDLKDEIAQKYVSVLERKSNRLKILIDDLVEASKASSGVMELEIHTLNFGELVRQTNAEFEDRFEEKALELVLEVPEEALLFRGDGRRVFRILENLYNNTVKYAMENTRVYVSLEQTEDSVVFCMKNISATKLNITPEELTERFVRGDRSRTTEGSGLGLSIAKSLTELMQGSFVIELDGDLYCAKVSFPVLSE